MLEKKTKQCSFCSEEILETAIKCKHCKSDLIENKKNSLKERMQVIEREEEKKKREREKWLKTLSPKELKREKKKQVLNKFAVAVIVLIIFGTWGYMGLTTFSDRNSKGSNTSSSSSSDNGDVASVCAQNYVKFLLKSPSSAKFPWNLASSSLGGNKYRVVNYVDSQNSFGAMIRTNYSCEVTVKNPKEFLCDTSCEILN